MKKQQVMLSMAITSWLIGFYVYQPVYGASQLQDIQVKADRNIEKAKWSSQKINIISQKDIQDKQAKSVEDIIFNQTGLSRTVDSMGRVGVSIRGADPRHTLILIDGQPALGEFAKYQGQGDELMRLGSENLDHIEVIQGAASGKYGSGAIGGVINVITKKPMDNRTVQFNIESLRTKGMQSSTPYSNYFLRADTGRVGSLKLALYGSKRDILPVYANNPRKSSKLAHDNMSVFAKNSLRFFGEQSNIGVSLDWEKDNHNTINFKLDSHKDQLHRFNKGSTSIMAPEVQFKRTIMRDAYNLNWHTKNKKKVNWDVEVNYVKLNENDVTLTNTIGHESYFGANELNNVDLIHHKEFDMHSNFHIDVNDKHFVNIGMGIKKEDGSGSRLKSAPTTSKWYINPWDYDKHLKEDPTTHEVASRIEDYPIERDENNTPYWNRLKEWYGYEKGVEGKEYLPKFTYEEFFSQEHAFDLADSYPSGITSSHLNSNNRISYFLEHTTPEKRNHFNQLVAKLYEENPDIKKAMETESTIAQSKIVYYYFTGKPMQIGKKSFPVLLNGVAFKKGDALHNRMTIGEATIKKQYVYFEDNWQIDDNTLLTPIIRMDHSNLFGNNLSFNMGMVHSLHGDSHKRLKANIGTSYAEPGMGELYYNWEMYPGNPISGGIGGGTARLGWYWIGNPYLKPEKSFNVDIGWEHETKNTSYRTTIFHNTIRDYHTLYFTGQLLDFYPEYNENTHLGAQKFSHTPDMIYSFKNIGDVSITGIESEVTHKFSDKWSGKLGYTFLHTLNNSDPAMPKQLLDKPKHKLDIALTYDDKKLGWYASLYGNYYIDMLDSRSLSGSGNYIDSYGPSEKESPNISHIETYFAHGKTQKYQSKTYGIWNFIVQKSWGADMRAYIGIDNIFNYRDDDRALQERVYRFGINFKFGSDGHLYKVITDQVNKKIDNIDLGLIHFDKFLLTPYEQISNSKLHFVGDYIWKSHYMQGENRPNVRTTLTSAIGTATKNMIDPSEHGWEQKVELGLEGRVDERTKIKILTSASGHKGAMTEDNEKTTHGVNQLHIEEANLTRVNRKWNISIGRLGEKLGETGYWFNQHFDGIRAVWSHKKTQVRIGYGDFSKNTGINDSAYTQISYKTMQRPLTVSEFLDNVDGLTLTKPFTPLHKALQEKVGDSTGQYATLRTYYNWLKQAYPDYLKKDETYYYVTIPKAVYGYTKTYDSVIANKKPEKVGEAGIKYLTETRTYPFYSSDIDKYATSEQHFPKSKYVELPVVENKDILSVSYDNDAPIQGDGSDFIKKFIDTHGDELTKRYDKALSERIQHEEDVSLAEYNEAKDNLAVYTAKKEEAQRNFEKLDKDVKIFEATHPEVKGTLGDYYGKIYSDNSLTPLEQEHFDLLKARVKEDVKIDKFTSDINDAKESMERPPFKATEITGKTVDKNILFSTIQKGNILPADGEKNKGLVAPVAAYAEKMDNALRFTEKGSLYPRAPLGASTGVFVMQPGYVLDRSVVPAIGEAFFLELKQEMQQNLGISVWYLHSQANRELMYESAREDGGIRSNELRYYTTVADILALSARYTLRNQALFSIDWGINMSSLGKYLNGHMQYQYDTHTNAFSLAGNTSGNTPKFFAVRAQIGKADMDNVHSWSMYADYKYFEHGSFFGGNGTGVLTDRYLDGIKSFTIGGSYVPFNNCLFELSYTFGAKGIKNRDTLFGPEKFSLGNYSTVQMTYKF